MTPFTDSLTQMPFGQSYIPPPIYPNAFRLQTPLRIPFFRCFLVKSTFYSVPFMQMLFDYRHHYGNHFFRCFLVKSIFYSVPFMQMLFDYRHHTGAHSFRCFLVKGTLYISDSSKCFPINDTFTAPFKQMLLDQRHLLLSHSCKCFLTKGTFYYPIHANAFNQKSLFLHH